MSQTAMPHLDLERAEELVRRLAAAVSARRIYAPDHARVQTALLEFLAPLRSSLEQEGVERFRLTVTGGLLTHEGVPLGTDGPNAQLAQMLEERSCGGVVFRASVRDETATVFLDWLAGRRAPVLRPKGEGLEVLDAGAGEELQDRQEKTRNVERFPEFKLPRQVLETSLQVFGHFMDDARAGRALDFGEIGSLTQLACDAARQGGVGLFAATQIPRPQPAACDHAVNVFLIATSLLQPFARDPKHLEILAQAALLHDVGTSWVDEAIVRKRGPMTAEEESHLRRHPEYGAKILASIPYADPLAVEVAYCHHMRDDGEGYPRPVMPILPGPVTNLVQVGDMFEAVAERRSPGVGLGVEQAVNCLLQEPGMASKHKTIALFVRRLTNAPPGSEVRLENGQRAVVVEVFPKAPHHPRVRVVRDSDGKPVAEPHLLDLREAGPDSRPIAEVYLKPSM